MSEKEIGMEGNKCNAKLGVLAEFHNQMEGRKLNELVEVAVMKLIKYEGKIKYAFMFYEYEWGDAWINENKKVSCRKYVGDIPLAQIGVKYGGH